MTTDISTEVFTPYHDAPTTLEPLPPSSHDVAPAGALPKPEKIATVKSTTSSSTTTGYGELVGLVVQMAEIVAVAYLLIMAVSLDNHLAQQMLAPIVALVFAHNSLSPSQWGGGPANS